MGTWSYGRLSIGTCCWKTGHSEAVTARLWEIHALGPICGCHLCFNGPSIYTPVMPILATSTNPSPFVYLLVQSKFTSSMVNTFWYLPCFEEPAGHKFTSPPRVLARMLKCLQDSEFLLIQSYVLASLIKYPHYQMSIPLASASPCWLMLPAPLEYTLFLLSPGPAHLSRGMLGLDPISLPGTRRRGCAPRSYLLY